MAGESPPGAAGSEKNARSAETGHWRWWHTVGLIVLTGGLVGMGIWRPLGVYASWLAVMAILVVFIAVAGQGIKGMWRGALIDDRNKISLSRLQMLTWTIVVLSAFGVVGIARSLDNPLTGLDVGVPATLWLLMGISTTSLLGSPLIKNSKMGEAKPEDAAKRLTEQGADPTTMRVEGQIVANDSVRAARWSDLFTGEEVANVTHLDLAKIQMFFFTLLVVLSYCVAVGASLRSGTLPDSLPDVGDGMLTLLGISHGGYLAGKALPAPKSRGAQGEGG